MKDHIGASFFLLDGRKLKLGGAVAFPFNGLVRLVRAGEDLHFIGHHEGRIKSKTKLTNDILGVAFIFEFLYKFGCTGEGNLVNVFLDFFTGHAEALVADRDRLLLFVKTDLDPQFAQFVFEFPNGGKLLQLLGGIHRIAHQFAQKDFVIGIQEFLDDGEYVLRMDRDGAFFLHKSTDFKVCEPFQILFHVSINDRMAG